MKLNDQGFRIVEMPPADPALLASFDNLPLDEYCGGKQRFHRFSQYKMTYIGDRWRFEVLPHRPLVQPKAYNVHSGGRFRHIDAIEVDPSVYLDAVVKGGQLDTRRAWHLDVNQYRVIANPEIEGVCVPEGAHQDGHSYVMIMVFRRRRITGAELALLPLDSKRPFFRTTIQENQAIILDDTRMRHDATNIEPAEASGSGYRDYFGTSLNPWEDRRYGPEFERRALAAV